MTEENREENRQERRVPNFLYHEERHMQVKAELALTRYQVQMYEREIKRRQHLLDLIIENRPKNIKARGLKYHSREELDQAYLVSDMTTKEYMQQRSALWNVYSDRGHTAEIAWLKEEKAKYQRKLDRIEKWMEDTKKQSKRDRNERWMRPIKMRKRHNASARRIRARKRKEALQERWRKYGIG